jgi:hypothetical protein
MVPPSFNQAEDLRFRHLYGPGVCRLKKTAAFFEVLGEGIGTLIKGSKSNKNCRFWQEGLKEKKGGRRRMGHGNVNDPMLLADLGNLWTKMSICFNVFEFVKNPHHEGHKAHEGVEKYDFHEQIGNLAYPADFFLNAACFCQSCFLADR